MEPATKVSFPTGQGTLAEFRQEMADIASGKGPLPAQALQALAKRGYGRHSPEMLAAEQKLRDYLMNKYGLAVMELVIKNQETAQKSLADALKK